MSHETMVLAIDPGVRVTGWALFASGKLVACGLSVYKGPPASHLAAVAHDANVPEGADHTVVEQMIHYPEEANRRSKRGKPRHVRDATAQDLIDCATVGAYLAAKKGGSFAQAPAREWKGQLSKDVSENRIRGILSDDEEATMDADLSEFPAGIRHNGIDAVGQGLHFLGRKKVSHGSR